VARAQRPCEYRGGCRRRETRYRCAGDVFLPLVKHRYPTGAVVDLRRVCAVYDPGAAQGRVTRHFKPDINLDRPEATHVSVECVMLRKDGSETRTVICFSEPVLGRDYALLRTPSASIELGSPL